VKQDLFLNFLEVRDINSFLYEIDAQTTFAMRLEWNSNLTQWNSNT
jgi:hypothetical protein